jgi:hypothetical protein
MGRQLAGLIRSPVPAWVDSRLRPLRGLASPGRAVARLEDASLSCCALCSANAPREGSRRRVDLQRAAWLRVPAGSASRPPFGRSGRTGQLACWSLRQTDWTPARLSASRWPARQKNSVRAVFGLSRASGGAG